MVQAHGGLRSTACQASARHLHGALGVAPLLTDAAGLLEVRQLQQGLRHRLGPSYWPVLALAGDLQDTQQRPVSSHCAVHCMLPAAPFTPWHAPPARHDCLAAPPPSLP
jgi:hypothetical protein